MTKHRRLWPTVADVVEVTAELTGVPAWEITGPSRARTVFRARHVAVWATREATHCSWPEIGRAFGGRDHTTAMNAAHRAEADEDLLRTARAVVEVVCGAVDNPVENLPLNITD